MKSFKMKPVTDSPPHFQIERDSSGCFFDQRTRDLLPAYGNRSAIEAVSAVRAAARFLHLMQERWAEAQGLSEGRMQILFMLRKNQETGLSLGTLADWLRVSPRNITGLVDNLEKAGLVERVPDASDRRSVHARLTEAGKARIEAIWKPAMERQFPLAEGFTEEELVQLRHLCLKLLANGYEIGRQDDGSHNS